jgi:hypothetical protein
VLSSFLLLISIVSDELGILFSCNSKSSFDVLVVVQYLITFLSRPSLKNELSSNKW